MDLSRRGNHAGVFLPRKLKADTATRQKRYLHRCEILKDALQVRLCCIGRET